MYVHLLEQVGHQICHFCVCGLLFAFQQENLSVSLETLPNLWRDAIRLIIGHHFLGYRLHT